MWVRLCTRLLDRRRGACAAPLGPRLHCGLLRWAEARTSRDLDDARSLGAPEAYDLFFVEDQPSHSDYYCIRTAEAASDGAVCVFADHSIVGSSWGSVAAFIAWANSRSPLLGHLTALQRTWPVESTVKNGRSSSKKLTHRRQREPKDQKWHAGVTRQLSGGNMTRSRSRFLGAAGLLFVACTLLAAAPPMLKGSGPGLRSRWRLPLRAEGWQAHHQRPRHPAQPRRRQRPGQRPRRS